MRAEFVRSGAFKRGAQGVQRCPDNGPASAGIDPQCSVPRCPHRPTLSTPLRPAAGVRRLERSVFARGALLGLMLLPALCLAQLSPAAKKEIEGLLHAVGASGCEFVRGNSTYSAAQAQVHLATKYEYLVLRGLLASTEEFIEKAATGSSMTGEPYAIRCAPRAPQRSDEWLRARLRSMRQAPAPHQGLGPRGTALEQ